MLPKYDVCVGVFCCTAYWEHFRLFRSEKYAVSYARVSLETRAESQVGFLQIVRYFLSDLNRNWSDSTILVKLSDMAFIKSV
jgi:hypothetical protein